jgi:hypothetical protein
MPNRRDTPEVACLTARFANLYLSLIMRDMQKTLQKNVVGEMILWRFAQTVNLSMVYQEVTEMGMQRLP